MSSNQDAIILQDVAEEDMMHEKEKQENLNKYTLSKYILCFESLKQDTFEYNLTPLLAEDIIFKDPFNEVQGIDATLNIFAHMFATLLEPKFVVTHSAISGHVAYIHWKFSFKTEPNQDAKIIDGLSQIHFNLQHQIHKHIDYWDSGEQLYLKVPVLGWFIQLIKNKLSADR